MDALTIDASGIKVASYREIREDLQDKFKAVFGSDMNVDPSSPDGMLIDIFAYAYNAIAQNLQGIVTNLNVATAEGVFLDYLANIAVGGRNEGESDEALLKRVQSADHYGYATYNGMLTYLQKYMGANTGLQTNETNKTVGDLEPYSFMVSVPADCTLTNDEIAAVIWACKPAGIKSVGSFSGKVTAENGQTFTVAFSKVAYVPVWFKITITEYNEETLPKDYEDEIKAAVVAWAKTEYSNGKDVILQRVIIPVFSVPGIQSVEVLAKTSASAAWSSEARISVGASNYATVSADNITVVIE